MPGATVSERNPKILADYTQIINKDYYEDTPSQIPHSHTVIIVPQKRPATFEIWP